MGPPVGGCVNVQGPRDIDTLVGRNTMMMCIYRLF
jgi:hypothetical protein